MDKLTKKGLDGTQLKTIALALMVLDLSLIHIWNTSGEGGLLGTN